MSTVICFFSPASVNPPFSSTWQQKEEVQGGDMATWQQKSKYKRETWQHGNKRGSTSWQHGNSPVGSHAILPRTWRLYVSLVPLRPTLVFQCSPEGEKDYFSCLWTAFNWSHLLQASSLDHHRPPVACYGKHFEAALVSPQVLPSVASFYLWLSSCLWTWGNPQRGWGGKAGIDQRRGGGVESDVEAYFVS